MDKYKGEMLYEAIMVDTFYKKIGPTLWSPPGDERTAKIAEIKDTIFPTITALLEKHLPADKKFIAGDSMTIHDFTIGGRLINIFENPNIKEP